MEIKIKLSFLVQLRSLKQKRKLIQRIKKKQKDKLNYGIIHV